MAVGRNEAEAIIRIIGEDQVTQILDAAKRKLQETGNEADKVAKKSLDISAAWDDFTGQIDNVQRKLGVLVAMEIGQQIAAGFSAAFAAVEDGARLIAADGAFGRAFADASGTLERLRDATRGMVADSSLQALAVQAQRSGLSIDIMARLFDVATRAAIGTGQATADVVEQLLELTRGTANETEEGLKRFGIVADTDAAQRRYAESLGLTTGQLTKQQVAAASTATVIDEVGRAFEDTTGSQAIERVSRFDAGWQNFKDTLKETAVNAVDFAASLIPGVEAAERLAEADRKRADAKQTLSALIEEIKKSELDQYQQSFLLHRLADTTDQADIKATLAIIRGLNERTDARRAAARAEAEAAQQHIASLVSEVEQTEGAAEAAIQHQRELAHVAEALGLSEQAGRGWVGVLDDLGKAHLIAADYVTDLYAAVRASNNEMARAIELQAELAAAAGDLAGAAALRAQAAGLLTGDSGQRTEPAGGGGGGGRRTDPMVAKRAEWARAEADAARAAQAAWDDAARAFAGVAAEIADYQAQQAADLDRERVAAALQERAAAEAALTDSRRAGYDSLRDSVLGLRDALGEVDGISLDGLANAAGGMGALVAQFQAVAEAAESSRDSIASGALGAVAASGRMVAGVIKDQRAQAIIMTLVEQAEAWGAFGRGDYVGFGAHLASSALWGYVAGKGGAAAAGAAGGGAGRAGGRGRETPSLPAASGQQAAPAPSQPVIVNITGGTYMGTESTTVGRDLGKLLAGEAGKTARADGRAMAPR